MSGLKDLFLWNTESLVTTPSDESLRGWTLRSFSQPSITAGLMGSADAFEVRVPPSTERRSAVLSIRQPDNHRFTPSRRLRSGRVRVCVRGRVPAKSNEIPAVPALLKLLELDDATVTLDAMHCQVRETLQEVHRNEPRCGIAAPIDPHSRPHCTTQVTKLEAFCGDGRLRFGEDHRDRMPPIRKRRWRSHEDFSDENSTYAKNETQTETLSKLSVFSLRLFVFLSLTADSSHRRHF